MADDTRQPREDLSREALTVHPENRPFAGTQWQNGKAQPYQPPENANLIAGGTEHTAGGKAPDVTIANAFQNGVKLSDFLELPKRPCVRDALMTGIGSGFALGGVRAIFGAAIWNACSWAVGACCFGAPVMYQYCLYKRQAEKEGMMRAVEILNKKEGERRAREQRKEKVKEERRQAKDLEQDAQLAALKEAQGAKPDSSGGRPWWKPGDDAREPKLTFRLSETLAQLRDPSQVKLTIVAVVSNVKEVLLSDVAQHTPAWL